MVNSDGSHEAGSDVVTGQCLGYPKRKLIFFVVMFYVVFFTFGFILFIYIDLNAFSGHVSPSDMVTLTNVEPLFCAAAGVDASSTLEIYRFREKPHLLQTKTEYDFKAEDYYQDDGYKYFRFYLTIGTRLSIGLHGVYNQKTVYVFSGQKSWANYKEDHLCNCWQQMSTVSSNDPFLLMDLYQNGEYFIYAENGDISIKLYRTTYDLKNAYCACIGQKCHVSLSNYEDKVLAYYPYSDKQNGDVTVNVTCSPRVWLYLVIFVCTPTLFLFIGLMSSRFYFKLKARQNLINRNETDQREATHINSTLPPSYHTVVFDGLPSYEEAIRAKPVTSNIEA